MKIEETIKKLVVLKFVDEFEEVINLLDHPMLIAHFAKINYQDYLQNELKNKYPNYYADVIDYFLGENETTDGILDVFYNVDFQVTNAFATAKLNKYFNNRECKIQGVSDYSLLSTVNSFDELLEKHEDEAMDLLENLADKNYCESTYKAIIVSFLELIIQEIETEISESCVDLEEAIQTMYLSEKGKSRSFDTFFIERKKIIETEI